MRANKLQIDKIKGKDLYKALKTLIYHNNGKIIFWVKNKAYVADKKEIRKFTEFNNNLKYGSVPSSYN